MLQGRTNHLDVMRWLIQVGQAETLYTVSSVLSTTVTIFQKGQKICPYGSMEMIFNQSFLINQSRPYKSW